MYDVSELMAGWLGRVDGWVYLQTTRPDGNTIADEEQQTPISDTSNASGDGFLKRSIFSMI